MYDHETGNKQFAINKLHRDWKKCWIRKHRTERYKGQGQRIQERVKFINNEYEDQAKEVWLFKKLSVE